MAPVITIEFFVPPPSESFVVIVKSLSADVCANVTLLLETVTENSCASPTINPVSASIVIAPVVVSAASALKKLPPAIIEDDVFVVPDTSNADADVVVPSNTAPKVEFKVIPALIEVHVHTEDWHRPLLFEMGVTTVRDVGCELEAVLSRRLWWNSEGTIGPHLLCTGPVLDCPGNTWPATTQIVKSPEDARTQVDYLVERGVDQIKTYAYLDLPCFEAIVNQAQIHGKFVLSHLGKNVDASQAIKAGVNEIEHLSGVSEAMWWEQNQSSKTWDWIKLWANIDKERMNQLIDLILEKDIWMAVTRIVWLRLASTWDTSLVNHPQMKYITGCLLYTSPSPRD